MTNYTVIDSLMGAGKTQYIIQEMNADRNIDKKYIYITPYLAEVERIIDNVKERPIKQPTQRNSEGRKLRGLKTLVQSGYSIASTHSLLQTADSELVELIKAGNYTLVIDEVINVVNDVNISQKDINRLIANGDITIDDDTKKIEWTGETDYDTRFSDIYLLCKAGTLYRNRDKTVVKIFSDEVLRAFAEVVVMTYLFEYSEMKAWYELNAIEYEKKSVTYNDDQQAYKLIEYDVMREDRQAIYDLITVHDGKYNEQLAHINLSATALRNLPTQDSYLEDLDLIEKTIRNFLHANKLEGYSGYWTTLRDTMDRLSPKGYSKKSKISLNCRATNEYSDGYAMAYIFERNINPMQQGFFIDRGATLDGNGWAVSDLLQWIFRSRIRNGQDIQLFLPAKKMRTILKQWSKYEL